MFVTAIVVIAHTLCIHTYVTLLDADFFCYFDVFFMSCRVIEVVASHFGNIMVNWKYLTHLRGRIEALRLYRHTESVDFSCPRKYTNFTKLICIIRG